MPMAGDAETKRRQEEYLQLAEELQRRNGVPRFKNFADFAEHDGLVLLGA
jgi:hypothetical protein